MSPQYVFHCPKCRVEFSHLYPLSKYLPATCTCPQCLTESKRVMFPESNWVFSPYLKEIGTDKLVPGLGWNSGGSSGIKGKKLEEI